LHRLWVLVTDCGDTAVTLPLALLVLVFLVGVRERRLAFYWVLMVLACGAAIGALKLVFGACTSRFGFLEIVSPSGHTAMSTAIYGSLALLVGASVRGPGRWAAYLAAAVLIAGIAVSRVMLQIHDAPEVVVGLIVGIGAAAGFRATLRHGPAPHLPVAWLALAGLAVAVAMHGTHWMVEPAVRHLAGSFRLVLPWCR
jgi:membrane-associated phospholipid phosphatase